MDRDMIKKFFVRFHRNILITRRQIDASSARDVPSWFRRRCLRPCERRRRRDAMTDNLWWVAMDLARDGVAGMYLNAGCCYLLPLQGDGLQAGRDDYRRIHCNECSENGPESNWLNDGRRQRSTCRLASSINGKSRRGIWCWSTDCQFH